VSKINSNTNFTRYAISNQKYYSSIKKFLRKVFFFKGKKNINQMFCQKPWGFAEPLSIHKRKNIYKKKIVIK